MDNKIYKIILLLIVVAIGGGLLAWYATSRPQEPQTIVPPEKIGLTDEERALVEAHLQASTTMNKKEQNEVDAYYKTSAKSSLTDEERAIILNNFKQ
jgi:hypothetical protein